MQKLIIGIALTIVSWQTGSASLQSEPVNLAGRTVRVDSAALVFSPGNWAGDDGRSGTQFRQTWNAGAYFRFYWSSETDHPTAKILFDTSTLGDAVRTKPLLTYEVDGKWTSGVELAPEVPIAKLAGAGHHILTVYLQSSEQEHRWGAPGNSGTNVMRFTGMEIGATDKLDIATQGHRWILEVGDSITEGIGANGSADVLSSYSYLVGQALQQQDFEFSVSACGWSGWLKPGDGAGDVPAYYAISGTTAGQGGKYDDAGSRWNKIDANTSLLDSAGHLSAYGARGQEPSIITINYGTNDGLRPSNESDLQASITQALKALRRSAPNAAIFMIIPFSRYSEREIKAAIASYQNGRQDKRLYTLDLGISVAMALTGIAPAMPTANSAGVTQSNRSTPPSASEAARTDTSSGSARTSANGSPSGRGPVNSGYWGGLHPNARGHAVLASRILADILTSTNGFNKSEFR